MKIAEFVLHPFGALVDPPAPGGLVGLGGEADVLEGLAVGPDEAAVAVGIVAGEVGVGAEFLEADPGVAGQAWNVFFKGVRRCLEHSWVQGF